jgi:uncharacterized SAM-binding protein YcdF (DUF218 family)
LTWLTRKLVLRIFLVVFLILFAYYLVTFFQVWRAAEDDDRRHSQAIIVLGAAQFDGRPSEVFRARLDHAADLYHDGVAPTVVVTGGKQQGDRFTEAQSGADYLAGKGIDQKDILRETTGKSSWESLAASARFLKQAGIRRVVLVSDPFHSLRIRLIAEELGFDAVTSPTRTSPISGLAVWWRYATEALRVAFGRIFGFGNLAKASRVGKVVPGLAILGAPSGVV